MSNEFNIKNGFISNNNSLVIGSLTATTYYGDGQYLSGIIATNWAGGNVTNPAYFLQGLSGTSISATTFYGDGTNITGIVAAFTGGTVTGGTIVSGGLTANTLNVTGNTNLSVVTATTLSGLTTLRSTSVSATTYQNLPVSGLTAGPNIGITGSNSNFTIFFTGTTGSNFTGGTVSGATIYTGGLSANTLTLTSLTPGTIISSLGVDSTGKVITGQTASNFTGGTVTGNTIYTAGLSANTLNVTGSSIFTGGLSSNLLSGTTISGDSYYLTSLGGSSGTLVGWDQSTGKFVIGTGGGGSAAPITGGTYDPSSESITFVNNTGGTVYVTGFKVYTDRRTDYAYPYQYSGSAPKGSSTSSLVWTIRRIAFSSATPTIDQAINVAWDNRVGASYSSY